VRRGGLRVVHLCAHPAGSSRYHARQKPLNGILTNSVLVTWEYIPMAVCANYRILAGKRNTFFFDSVLRVADSSQIAEANKMT
jgi:hypothetical protein